MTLDMYESDYFGHEDKWKLQVYFYLFRSIRRSLVSVQTDAVLPTSLTDAPFGSPPFEAVTGERLLANYVAQKCGNSSDK
jgi:hypothetical protein